MGMLARERMQAVFGAALAVTAAWAAFAAWKGYEGAAPVVPHLAAPPPRAVAPLSGPVMVSPVDSGKASADSPIPLLVLPVAGVRPAMLVDTFAQARASGARRHDAIDIPALLGTPVIAAAPGRIEKLFLSRDGGNTIYLRSPDRRVIYYYAHLQDYAPGLAEGQQVEAGQALGRVGFSGNADPAAPHLHFAIWLTAPQARWWDPAFAIDPYPLLMRRK